MNTQMYGRIVLGASAALFGIIALMWHDADTWQYTAALWSLPFGTVIGDCLMVVLIISGLGLPFPPVARLASIVFCVVNVIFTLTCVPVVIAHPTDYGPYVPLFEQLSVAVGAFAVYAASITDDARSAALGRTVRILLGVCTVSFALAQVVYFKFTASLVPTWIPLGPDFWTVLTTAAFGLAAIALLINVKARLATRLMTLMLALFGLLIWVPAVVTHPVHNNWSEFAINFLITGAVWVIAELKTL